MPPGGPPPLCAKRVGHGGTLDPDATGVLPVLIGEATKLMPYLVDQDKEYVATLRFGITTDTHDLSGRVLSEAPVPPLTRAALENACRPFVGRIMQVPPMYSAVHHGGKRLYPLPRAGRGRRGPGPGPRSGRVSDRPRRRWARGRAWSSTGAPPLPSGTAKRWRSSPRRPAGG